MRAKGEEMIRVDVTQTDIDQGCRNDMDCCPVARGLERASAPFFGGLGQGRVFANRDEMLIIGCGHLCMEAPDVVCAFVEAFDDYDPSYPDYSSLELDAARTLIQPFSFEIPDLDSPEWKEECHDCGMMFSPDELDDSGFCADCAEKEAAE